MTATERAKRSDALYYETVSVNRRVLCDMVANRESDLEDAKAENEHMRIKALAVVGELQEENERLKAENDNLRELVRDMWLQLLNAYDRKELDGFTDRMRELEVDACPNCGAKVVDPTTNYVDVEVEQ